MNICFATWELSGINPGGIGTIIGNYVNFFGNQTDINFHVLWYGNTTLIKKARYIYPKIVFHDVTELANAWQQREEKRSLTFPSQSLSYQSNLRADVQAHRIMEAVKELEINGCEFDVLEFPDFCGPAHCVIMERKLKRINSIKTLSVRVHSTETVLRGWDHRPFTPNNSIRTALERYSLQNCDLVVSHLPSVSKSVQKAFGFSEEWLSDVVHENPPVLLDDFNLKSQNSLKAKNLLFSSKIQWFKRPDLFVRSAVRFMSRFPDYDGNAVLAAHKIDSELEVYCRSLIPPNLQNRFLFEAKLSTKQRNELISNSVCVFTSDYESFCLAAYEASILGAVVVLNEANPAFDKQSPWADGVNCLKYLGGVSELAEAIEKAIFSDRQRAVCKSIVSKEPVYHHLTSASAAYAVDDKGTSATEVSIIVVVPPYYQGHSLFLTSMNREELHSVSVVVVHAGYCEKDDVIIETKKRVADNVMLRERVHFIDAGAGASLGEMLNTAISETASDFYIIHRAGMAVNLEFVKLIGSLEAGEGTDIIIPQVEVYNEDTSNYEVRSPVVELSLSSVLGSDVLHRLEFAASRSYLSENLLSEEMDDYTLIQSLLRCSTIDKSFVSTPLVGFSCFVKPSVQEGKRVHLDMLLRRPAGLELMGGHTALNLLDVSSQLLATADQGKNTQPTRPIRDRNQGGVEIQRLTRHVSKPINSVIQSTSRELESKFGLKPKYVEALLIVLVYFLGVMTPLVF